MAQDHSLDNKAGQQADASLDLSQKAKVAAQQLQEHGWAVIEGVLTPAECQQYQDGVWRWLEGLGVGLDRRDPATWHSEAWPPSFKGIINSLEVAHQDFVWRVRKHPAVLQVFAELWGTNELLSSFDSINVARPGRSEATGHGWLHVDQAPLRRGLFCIQGLVNIVDVGPDTTGTLMVKHGSHASHQAFFERHTTLTPEQQAATPDFYMFQSAELSFWDAFDSRPLSAPAGSLFLWDSRTAHQNVLPQAAEQWRHVCYCCYQPRSLATAADLDEKRRAYAEFRATTHWPARLVRTFPVVGEEGYFESLSSANGMLSFWSERMRDEAARSQVVANRTRNEVEDEALLKLAGVREYDEREVWRREPLLQLSEAMVASRTGNAL